MHDRSRRARGALAMVFAVVALIMGDVAWAGAQAPAVDRPPAPTDEKRAADAGRQAGPQQANEPLRPAAAASGGPAPATAAAVAGQPQFVTYRVFATQYEPHVAGAVEVALPDRCVKFAALRNTSALSQANCGPGYPLDLDYRVAVTLDNGRSAALPVREVGPWNLDDNYWNPTSGTPRPRRRFTDLPTGTPASQAAFYDGYNLKANCSDLDEKPTSRVAGADQFGRCVLNPAGIDLSPAAAAQLGLPNFENAWVTVSFLWEPADSTYVAVSPRRILDTREGLGAPRAPVGPDKTIDLAVAGAGGVPVTGVSAVVLNLTATDMVGPETYLTVFPAGSPRPEASTLNLGQGQTVPNLVVARLGSGGKVSIYNHFGNVAVVADVQGWYVSSASIGARYTPVTPTRILDTRDGTGRGGAVGPVPWAGTIEVPVTGVGGVPESFVGAVVLNVTATGLRGPDTHVTVYPSGQSKPTASNLNVSPGPATSNLVIAMVTNGRVNMYNNAGSVDLIADVQGWFGPGGEANFFSTAPVRILDTRTGKGGTSGKVGPDRTIELAIGGANGVPPGVRAVAVNVTVTEHAGPESHLVAYPAGRTRQRASNLNYAAGQTKANLVMVRVGDNGRISLYNHVGEVHVVADVQGWYP